MATRPRNRTACLSAALLASDDLAREILSQIQKGHLSRLDEALFVRQDGSQVPVLLSISPIRKSEGQLSGSAIIARDISARKQAEREMAHRALHDSLTGLPNRLSLGNRLADSIASADLDASGTAVVFVDLDGFKFVNDTLGHEAGDVLLQQVAQRLSACVRRGDMLARMGGDEFMVVVNGVTDDQLAQSVAEPPGRRAARSVLRGSSRTRRHRQHGHQHLSQGRHGRKRTAPQRRRRHVRG